MDISCRLQGSADDDLTQLATGIVFYSPRDCIYTLFMAVVTVPFLVWEPKT